MVSKKKGNTMEGRIEDCRVCKVIKKVEKERAYLFLCISAGRTCVYSSHMGIPVFMHLRWTYLCLFISHGHTCVYASHLGIPVFIYLTWAYLCLCISPGHTCVYASHLVHTCVYLSHLGIPVIPAILKFLLL